MKVFKKYKAFNKLRYLVKEKGISSNYERNLNYQVTDHKNRKIDLFVNGYMTIETKTSIFHLTSMLYFIEMTDKNGTNVKCKLTFLNSLIKIVEEL